MEYQLIYHSRANVDVHSAEIDEILQEAKAYNAAHNITGCLLFHNQQFLQLLEGEQKEIESLFATIKTAKHHKDVSVVSQREVNERLFRISPMVFEVVGRDDLQMVGVPNHEDVDFAIEQPDKALALFAYISKQLRENMKHGHNAVKGPLV